MVRLHFWQLELSIKSLPRLTLVTPEAENSYSKRWTRYLAKQRPR